MFALHAEAKKNKQHQQPSAPATITSPLISSTSSSMTSASESKQSHIRDTNNGPIIPVPSASSSLPQSISTPTPTPPSPPSNLNPRDAFFLVDQVFENSPAQSADLHIGDQILLFGSIHKQNYQPQTLKQLVENSKGRGIRVTVYRNGEGIQTLTLVPQAWEGQGLLGCHLTPISL